MGPAGLIISIFILVFLSTFFSLSETAVVSAPEEKVFKFHQDGVLRASAALKILANKEKIVSIALLCDNLVNIAASSLSAVFFANLFGEFDEIGVLCSTVIMTALVFVFGEVLPKMMALRQPTAILLFISPVFLLLWKVLYPVIWFVDVITRKLVFLLHIKNEEDTEDADSSILGAVEMYHKKGMLERDEKNMLSGVLKLDEVDMKDVMTHRSDVFAIDVNENKEEIVKKIAATTFSKIPFYDKSDNDIIGYLKAIDLMREVYKHNNDINKINLRSLMVSPWYLPGDASVGKHLQEFKNKGDTMAFVVDEYGGFMGVVTLEDVLEEIVGDIHGDGNDIKSDVVVDVDGGFIVPADMNLLDVNEKIGSNFTDSEVSTVGGFLLNKIENIPQSGETYVIGEYRFDIIMATATSIEKIKICKNTNNYISDNKTSQSLSQQKELAIKKE